MKPPGEHTLTQNMPLHRVDHIRASSGIRQIELSIQSKQLKCVMMIRPSRASAGTHKTNPVARILNLNRSIGQLRLRPRSRPQAPSRRREY